MSLKTKFALKRAGQLFLGLEKHFDFTTTLYPFYADRDQYK